MRQFHIAKGIKKIKREKVSGEKKMIIKVHAKLTKQLLVRYGLKKKKLYPL